MKQALGTEAVVYPYMLDAKEGYRWSWNLFILVAGPALPNWIVTLEPSLNIFPVRDLCGIAHEATDAAEFRRRWLHDRNACARDADARRKAAAAPIKSPSQIPA